ncbi:MAG: hypothetical protein KAI81_05915 [Candidatus Marinimicrobia bacterium]|nr:hypothetical protein [Candidatus Neomarinimicrobiota bacterium]
MQDLKKRYKKIFKDNNVDCLDNSIDFSFSEDDIMTTGGDIQHDSGLLLGYYQPKIVDQYFKRYRIPKIFKTLGIKDEIKTHLDLNDPYLHKFTIYTGENLDDKKIVEIFFRKRSLAIPSTSNNNKRADTLYIDWLLMQNPYKKFRSMKPSLPGQKHPGLRIGDHILEILFNVAKRIKCDGLANSPNYLHTAVLFSKELMFIDPAMQAVSDATKGFLLRRYSLSTVAWASVHGAIIFNETNEIFKWVSSPMILPLSTKMKHYFNSRWYKKQYREAKDKFRVRIDLDKLQKKMSEPATNTF